MTDLLFAALAALPLLLAAVAVCGLLFLPLRARGVRAELVLHIGGEADPSEQILLGAEFLAAVGGIRARIDLRDADPAFTALARRRARADGRLHIVTNGENGKTDCQNEGESGDG